VTLTSADVVTTDDQGELAETGSVVNWVLPIVGVALVLGGILFLLFRRFRPTHK
jgi:LPXTG-motif cell wall-anchored protein